MKVLEDLDHIPGEKAVGLLGAFVKILDRRKLRLRENPGAPETSFEGFNGRLSDVKLRRNIVAKARKCG